MSDLREAYAVALYSGLGDDLDRRRPVDFIRGMGFAPALGRYLHRLRAHDSTAYRPVVDILEWRLTKLNKSKRLVPFTLIRSVVEAQVRSWLCDLCPSCSGRGKRAVERFNAESEHKLDQDCVRCGGIGRLGAKWHDFQGWGRVPQQRCEKFWEISWQLIERAERQAHATVCRQVERFKLISA